MSTFITDLMQSIFTPGPTHTLLVATNVTFACLQALLLALLVATYSVHFIVLSFLSAGLWWSINWFATEVKAVQEAEDRKKAESQELGSNNIQETETEATTAIDGSQIGSGSKEIEVGEHVGELKERGWSKGVKSGTSTEDEWERLSESEKDR